MRVQSSHHCRSCKRRHARACALRHTRVTVDDNTAGSPRAPRRGDDETSRQAQGWRVSDTLTPSTDAPDVGYVELAGWSPDGGHAVIAREVRDGSTTRRSFESIELATLAADKHASTLGGLGAAKRWVSTQWRRSTLALR
jgi:hypothetical protein